MDQYPRHAEASAFLAARPEQVFARLDDQAMLGSHMAKPSAMMLGGRMTYDLDAAQGRSVGAVIRMGGTFLGLTLSVVEVVTERTPPTLKVWETQGPQRMLVIEAYRMGFACKAEGSGTTLRVFIDYRLPAGRFGRIFGPIFAPIYARWCVARMVGDAKRHFGEGAQP